MTNILIIDDDQMLCEMVCRKLLTLGHEVSSAHTLSDGIAAANEIAFDLVILDVRLPDGSGIEALPQFRAIKPQPEIIIITGEGDPDSAELSIKTGAWDYIEKPISMREITLQVTRSLEFHQAKTTCQPKTMLKRDAIVGNAPLMEACLENVAQSACTDTPVLITGETGTGKELFARAIHANSNRSSGPFVVLDCAALPDKLVESLLFGHRKGSFTGADHARDGMILQANKGTLFMDEVGELPIAIQRAFLRVLQERRFRPIGSSQELKSDFRLVAATNRDLESMVQEGSFRKDLFFRLKAAVIQLPPLHERKTDIEKLALHYISIFCKRSGMITKGVSPEFMHSLQAYSWPGNVRELVNAIDVALANAQGHNVLIPMHLPVNIRVSLKRRTIGNAVTPIGAGGERAVQRVDLPPLKDALEETERRYLHSLMARTEANIPSACRISGLSRSGLYARLKKYNINRST
ncbi:sigma-54-dependent transcriptional regulator [Desulfosarcina ovata]|uniref:Fis family transcriptional regulator n=1 Tax=Desulfosarcina ovata subsp. ovata TaxID=2752305 RepID=A0A5K8A982_9BACT|nr:sigma-54 dependent transcriptional regulator [Desulfosarcina ovata]BBO89036.1 Fis family transcriptional regulator [Desulfosarcina ovata subsp. ovata]